MSSRSLKTYEDVARFSRSFAKRRGLNRETAHELCEILMDAFNSSSSGKLGVIKATALAMQFIGVAMEAVDAELHIV
jgi:hypothetical protein